MRSGMYVQYNFTITISQWFPNDFTISQQFHNFTMMSRFHNFNNDFTISTIPSKTIPWWFHNDLHPRFHDVFHNNFMTTILQQFYNVDARIQFYNDNNFMIHNSTMISWQFHNFITEMSQDILNDFTTITTIPCHHNSTIDFIIQWFHNDLWQFQQFHND